MVFQTEVSLSAIRRSLVTILLYVYLVTGVFFYDTLGIFQYVDELFVLVLLLVVVMFYPARMAKQWKLLFVAGCILFFYGMYSRWLGLNGWQAIVSDLVVETKPYLAFFLIYATGYVIPRRSIQSFRLLTYMLGVVLLTIALSGQDAIIKIFSHPSRFYSAGIILSLLFLVTSKRYGRKEFVISLMLFSLGFMSMKAKYFGEGVVFLLLSFYFLWGRNADLRLFRTGFSGFMRMMMILPLLIVPVYLAGKEKILFYFVKGTENPDNLFARPALFLRSFDVFWDYFPVGSGFASFASYFSANKGYSALYAQYGLDRVHGLTEAEPNFVADSYLPMLVAQFGLVGMILFIMFFVTSYKKATFWFRGNPLKPDASYLVVLFVMVLLLIESVADATIAQNRGVMYMVLLAIALNQLRPKNVSFSIQNRS